MCHEIEYNGMHGGSEWRYFNAGTFSVTSRRNIFCNFVVQLMTTGMIHEVTAMNLNLIRTTIEDKLLNDVWRRMKEIMKRKRTNSSSVEQSPEYDSPPHLHHVGTEGSCRTWASNADGSGFYYFVLLTMVIMTGSHLIALIGKNFPVLFSSVVMLR